ncbi:hypothetical protein N7455_008940 [Penicillium solitum]|uniref:uncharacterized protein n=1 Tax=Penicillium solitum TaxID=60172 RepID=UPI0032C405A4|nr:hypothetical protein N7455_008940 [Penicillium solitum]
MFGVFDISVKLASEKTKIPLLGVLLANIIKDVVKPSTLPNTAPDIDGIMKDLSAICVDFERFFVMLSVPDCGLDTLALTMRATGASSANAERTRAGER